MRTGGLRFRISPPWDPFFKKVRFQDPYESSAKTIKYMYVFAKERCRLDEAWEQNEPVLEQNQNQNNFRDTPNPVLHHYLHNISRRLLVKALLYEIMTLTMKC